MHFRETKNTSMTAGEAKWRSTKVLRQTDRLSDRETETDRQTDRQRATARNKIITTILEKKKSKHTKNQHTRELISALKTTHKYNSKDLGRLR